MPSRTQKPSCVEPDDIAESFGVGATPEAEPLGADPVFVRARRASLYGIADVRHLFGERTACPAECAGVWLSVSEPALGASLPAVVGGALS